MSAAFTQYFKNSQFDTFEDGESVDHTASNQFNKRGVLEGSRIFIVTVREGELYLGALVNVDRIISKREASALLGPQIYDATDHVIARNPQPFHADLKVPMEIASALRFSGNRQLVFTESGKIDQQTLRGVRQLSAESADRLLTLLENAPTTIQEIADIRAIEARKEATPTEKRTLIDARLGQGLFRRRVIELEGKCRITGIRLHDHLRASHIKPWCDSTDEERLDGNNGLLLAPHVDHLFDKGFIGFSDDGTMLISVTCPIELFSAWDLPTDINVGPFRQPQRTYLAYHRIKFGLE